ncbi:hypothetical protein ACLFMI_18850 [Pseudonocardia nantongensis]|uniref:hypothetical protein n=1 Tax=Pseudonocardia nantongensis TaxID=1181885 RepID=UPI00397DE9F4
MSVPRGADPRRFPPARPGLAAVPAQARDRAPGDPTVVSAEHQRLRNSLSPVLAGLRWPAYRWQVLAEAEAWGVSGLVREQLVPLPDGRYPSLEAILEVLAAVARGRARRPAPAPAIGADRLHPAERAVVRRHAGPGSGPARHTG